MSRRRVAAISAVIVFPVVAAAIVLVSLLDSGGSGKKPSGATQPANRPAAPSPSPSPNPAAPAAPAQSGGARPPARPLSVLDAGAPPKALSDKLGPVTAGGTINLAALRGAPIVLNIWSADCLPCRTETRVLQSEWDRLGSRGILFLGLNVLDSAAAARRFRADNGVTYPSVEEKRGDTARELGARGVPETFFISKTGKIVSHVIGAVSLAQVELGIKAAQTGHNLPPDQGGGQIPLR